MSKTEDLRRDLNRLKHLYVEELKDLYNAENQLVKALPKIAKAATAEDLRAGFEEHLEQTKGHVDRLEKIFKALGESPKGKKCKGMEGLIKEGAENDRGRSRARRTGRRTNFRGAARRAL
jgi:ferritin-like metal-binding protein YciE